MRPPSYCPNSWSQYALENSKLRKVRMINKINSRKAKIREKERTSFNKISASHEQIQRGDPSASFLNQCRFTDQTITDSYVDIIDCRAVSNEAQENGSASEIRRFQQNGQDSESFTTGAISILSGQSQKGQPLKGDYVKVNQKFRNRESAHRSRELKKLQFMQLQQDLEKAEKAQQMAKRQLQVSQKAAIGAENKYLKRIRDLEQVVRHCRLCRVHVNWEWEDTETETSQVQNDHIQQRTQLGYELDPLGDSDMGTFIDSKGVEEFSFQKSGMGSSLPMYFLVVMVAIAVIIVPNHFSAQAGTQKIINFTGLKNSLRSSQGSNSVNLPTQSQAFTPNRILLQVVSKQNSQESLGITDGASFEVQQSQLQENNIGSQYTSESAYIQPCASEECQLEECSSETSEDPKDTTNSYIEIESPLPLALGHQSELLSEEIVNDQKNWSFIYPQAQQLAISSSQLGKVG